MAFFTPKLGRTLEMYPDINMHTHNNLEADGLLTPRTYGFPSFKKTERRGIFPLLSALAVPSLATVKPEKKSMVTYYLTARAKMHPTE